MLICALSDLHGYLPKDIPKCEVVCIAGDIVPLNIQNDIAKSFIWFGHDFLPWCEDLPCEKVLLVAGNHDFFLEVFSNTHQAGKSYKFGDNSKVIYLCNSIYKFNHMKFYGTPNVTDLSGWAFNVEFPESKEVFGRIPDCDVLITHTLPFDANNTGNVFASPTKPDYGSWELRDAISERKIKYIFCGHVHTGNHKLSDWEGHYIANVSIKKEDYSPAFEPLLINTNENREDRM